MNVITFEVTLPLVEMSFKHSVCCLPPAELSALLTAVVLPAFFSLWVYSDFSLIRCRLVLFNYCTLFPPPLYWSWDTSFKFFHLCKFSVGARKEDVAGPCACLRAAVWWLQRASLHLLDDCELPRKSVHLSWISYFLKLIFLMFHDISQFCN